ncbi:ArsO family NAD(P)H-dependent flavin-containing monooxygenase [Owenweeksia hongkongensis]|uniref:ArsO family NAD(P)H-dependent flavin-containing monooxygenase n=1 Tax=Owenweeksia hongkongensis TaxID=253245 RepID=UPI003A9034C9
MLHYSENKIYDTIIIGGGQAGLSVAYFIKRTSSNYLILDDQSEPGGAWLHTWDSLNLFSPSQYSSLSGWQMPPCKKEYPTKYELLTYLAEYEKRYDFPVLRNTSVRQVSKSDEVFQVETNQGKFYCKSLVSATGTSKNPFIPAYPKANDFKGRQIHSVDYQNADDLVGKNVIVVGGGNSGAQILAEVSKVASTKWVTLNEPIFLPEHIDGRHLFAAANDKYFNKQAEESGPKISLSNIVQVDSVREGLKRGVFKDHRPFKAFYENGVIWNDDTKEPFDVIIWCTGFKANLSHLEKLDIIDNNRIETNYTRSVQEPGLWLVGYGNWTGFASATIFGVGKTAKHTAKEIASFLETKKAE